MAEITFDRERVTETILSNLYSGGVITEAEPEEIKKHLDSLDARTLLSILVESHQLREESYKPRTFIYIKKTCLN